MTNPKPPAGWYDDPSMVNTRRYWDGDAWTDHRQEKTADPVAPATASTSTGSGTPKWLLRGAGLALALLVLWLLVGNGWSTITGGYNIDRAELEGEVTTYLEEDDEATYEVSCSDPGRVQSGDRSFCDGTASDGREYQVEVTYQSGGGYIMQANQTN